ncbi:MAG: hypothetical protein QGG40_07105 [Myxococcota bacterium]|nr:hypothetical protein [Myxococcota bacterium]
MRNKLIRLLRSRQKSSCGRDDERRCGGLWARLRGLVDSVVATNPSGNNMSVR